MNDTPDKNRENRIKKISTTLNYASILTALIGLAFATLFSKDFFKHNELKRPNQVAIQKKKIDELSLKLSRLKSKIDSSIWLSKDSIQKINVTNIELKNIKSQTKYLNKKIENLELAILENPEKAVSIPLMRIQLENQKEQNENEFESLKDEIARVYDMNKWIIGLVFTMLVSIVVLNVSNLFAKNKEK